MTSFLEGCFPCSTVNQAARFGKLEEVKRLIDEGFAVDVSDNRGWKPLHEAAHGSYLECVKFLLSHEPADVNWQSFEGLTALHFACDNGNVELVQLLLDHGANPNLHDHMDTYPLLSAVKSKSIECIKLLLQHGAKINAQLYCGTSALHQAASEGFSSIVQILLDHGADLFIKEEYGITPLFSASQYGQTECAKIILERASSKDKKQLVNAGAEDGATPVYLAAQEGHSDLVALLLEHGASADIPTASPLALPLHAALQFSHVKCVEHLLPQTDKKALIKCDISPFYFALMCEEKHCTKALVKGGLSPSLRFKVDSSDVFSPKMLRYFRRVRYSKMVSPLVLACIYKCPLANALVLLEESASVNARTEFEVPPLLAALEYNNYKLAKNMIDHGVNVNIYHPKIISNMTVTVAIANWRCLGLVLQCGAEAESLFHVDPQPVVHRTPAAARLEQLEDCMSPEEVDDYENEMGVLKYPVPFWRVFAEARISTKTNLGQILRYVMYFVGNPPLDPTMKHYVDSEQEWAALCSIAETPRSLSHLCRLTIRRRISSPLLCNKTAIRNLPIPEVIMDYLLYKELENE